MTEQQTLAQPPPPPPAAAPPAAPKPPRTVGLRVLVAGTVGAFALGCLTGGGFGALIGYVAHPDARERNLPFQQQGFPAQPGAGLDQPSTS